MSSTESTPHRSGPAWLEAALRALERVALGGSVIALGTIVFAVVFQVIARYVTDVSTAWTPELAQTAFVWAALLAIPLGVRSERHMLVDVWSRFGDRIRAVIYVIASLAIIAIAGTLVYFGIAMLPISFRRTMPGLGISSGWQMLAVPIGFGLATIFQIELLIRRLIHRPAVTVVEPDPIDHALKEA